MPGTRSSRQHTWLLGLSCRRPSTHPLIVHVSYVFVATHDAGPSSGSTVVTANESFDSTLKRVDECFLNRRDSNIHDHVIERSACIAADERLLELPTEPSLSPNSIGRGNTLDHLRFVRYPCLLLAVAGK